MRSRWVVAVAGAALAACSSKPPAELVRGASVQVTDGFRNRAGVAVTDEHVLTDLELVKQADSAKIVGASGKSLDANVLRRDPDLGVALLVAKNAGMTAAPPGDAGALKPGSPLTAFIYDKAGVGTYRAAKVTGWRYHNGRAYIETDLEFEDDIEGAGIYDAQGHVVGLMSFALAPSLNYALPIEYLTSRGNIAGTLVGSDISEAFNEQRGEARKHTRPLERPLDETILVNSYSYSRSALVGKIVMLGRKAADAGQHRPVDFEVTATDAARKTRTIAKGQLTPPLVQWSAYPADVAQAKREELRRDFGDGYANEHFAPFEYGELRWRLTLPLFCKNVTGEEVHNVKLTLSDGRSTGPFGFADLINVCAAREDGDGTAWEQEWGMLAAAPAAAEAPEKATKSSKKAKKKKKKGKKHR